ncbi:MAG: hypothetical protein JXQ71_16265 [Verrucomicrobia bacterium]|nr:hypothetical protein [Verrucomicrobiota bacterium]
MTERKHSWVDQRSLALGCAVADKLESHPELLAVARRNVDQWIEQSSEAPLMAHLEWRKILEKDSLSKILALLRSHSEEACRLRQNSPFAGLLSPQERWRILNEYEAQPA